MIVGLLYLRYAYNFSDDQALKCWLEWPYMQQFTREMVFPHGLPRDSSSLTRWCNRLNEAGPEELLAQSMEPANTLKAIRPRELRLVSIDATVQGGDTADPTYSRLLQVAWPKLAERDPEAGIKLRQSSARSRPSAVQAHAPHDQTPAYDRRPTDA